MITLSLSLILLVVGYLFYSRFLEKVIKVDANMPVPAYKLQDGVDYIPMKPWRIFLIQFLNIAGLGPIFGAIMGAKFGPASFLWIVFGTVFGGAVHDYLAGMLSLRHDGSSLPDLHGRYLGNVIRHIMNAFMVVLLVLVGVVFLIGPAEILGEMTSSVRFLNSYFWIAVILIYYIIATLLPIDKIIGKIYPIFGVCLLVMAFGILGYLYVRHPQVPEIWQGLQNRQANPEANPIFPMMFVSIACGAISGFHASQSPLMARCMTNEKLGRPIFYGAMVAEGIVALIWAAAASVFFFSGEYAGEVAEFGGSAPQIVKFITENWLGGFGAILAMLGVVFAPISTGDTAFRSARLIISEFFHFEQKTMWKRLVIAVPLFVVAFAILIWDISNPDGFNIIWNYFAWSNQTLAAITLWAITVYLQRKQGSNVSFLLSLFPACFMTFICVSFICFAKIGFHLPVNISYLVAAVITLALANQFLRACYKRLRPGKTA